MNNERIFPKNFKAGECCSKTVDSSTLSCVDIHVCMVWEGKTSTFPNLIIRIPQEIKRPMWWLVKLCHIVTIPMLLHTTCSCTWTRHSCSNVQEDIQKTVSCLCAYLCISLWPICGDRSCKYHFVTYTFLRTWSYPLCCIKIAPPLMTSLYCRRWILIRATSTFTTLCESMTWFHSRSLNLWWEQ